MRNLRRKAHEAVDQTHSQDTVALSPDELDRLGGRTHLLSQFGSTSSPNQPSSVTGAAQRQFTPPMLSIPSDAVNMHPIIAQDMRNLDVG